MTAIKQHRLQPLLLYCLVVLLAFLPVCSFLFFLKNDAFVGYFPPKFFMSESIHAGHLPLWNPYINYGIPQYGDMSSGFWSPFTWLIAATTGYNAYTLTIELLLYILIGGLGMYKLTGYFKLEKTVRLMAGIAFMCSGYMIGHLQHFNWVSGAAFLPWCCWSYLELLAAFSWKKMIQAAILFYLLVSSAHPGITICAGYFFLALLLFHFFRNDEDRSAGYRLKNILRSNILLALALLLLSAGMIAGYLDILPYFIRGEKISLADSLSNPTNIQSWISILFPLSTVKNDAFFNTDPTMRNCYFGLTFLLFFLLGTLRKKSSWQYFLFLSGIVFMLLSTGGPFKTFAYRFIPFIGYVRLNGEFRIFALVPFILFSAIGLNRFILDKESFSGKTKWVYWLLELILFIMITVGLYQSISGKQGILYQLDTVIHAPSPASKLKALVDGISFYDTFWIQGFIQLFLLWGIKWCIIQKEWGILKKLVIADFVLASLLNIPFTGVGKASVADVQSLLNKAPKGIPVPALIPVIKMDTISTDEKLMIGDWSMYNKQIGSLYGVSYPIKLKNTVAYFDTKVLDTALSFDQYPYLFFTTASPDNIPAQPGKAGLANPIRVLSFNGHSISLEIKSNDDGNLVFMQSHYPHWFYDDGSGKHEVYRAGTCFMATPIKKGIHKVKFYFDPRLISNLLLFSFSALLIAVLIFFGLKLKKNI